MKDNGYKNIYINKAMEVNELSYEQKVNYKWRIFETIYRDANLNIWNDVVMDKILEKTEHIYEELTK